MEALEGKYTFESILLFDAEKQHKYKDEALVSNFYFTSLSTSLREIEKIKKDDEGKANELEENNQWILRESPRSKSIPVINFDRLPSICNADGMKSMDALIIDYSPNKLSYIIEFKNCSKQTLVKKFLNRQSDDGIFKKIKNSKNLICNSICFENIDDLVQRLHVIIVYNGKNDTVSDFQQPIIEKSISEKGKNGKQNKASLLNYRSSNRSTTNLELLGSEINRLSFASCSKDNFPIPGRPKYESVKYKKNTREFSLFSSSDFARLIEEFNFFDSINWDVYTPYLTSRIPQ